MPSLCQVLKEKPSLEVHKRIAVLLEAINERPPSPEWLRALRVLQVLESIGSAKAKKVLEGLSQGAARAGLMEEAKAALQRLARRSGEP